MGSLECKIEGKDGRKTTLREFMLTRKHDKSGKMLFSGVKLAPSQGNTASIKTEFLLTELANFKATKALIIVAKKYVSQKLAKDV